MATGPHFRKVNPDDGFFDASQCLPRVKEFIENHDALNLRCLQCMDIFSGHGNFERTCREKMKSCTPIDVLLNAKLHNLLTEFGFFYILTILLSVVSCLHWNQYENTSKICHPVHSLTYLFFKFFKRHTMVCPLEPGSRRLCAAGTTMWSLRIHICSLPRAKFRIPLWQPEQEKDPWV